MRRYCGVYVNVFVLALLAVLLSGCIGNLIPSVRQPTRLYDEDAEFATIRKWEESLRQLPGNENDTRSLWATYFRNGSPDDKKMFRNEVIAARMYAIDLEYTKYESQLTHENQDINFATTAASLGLTTTASLVPVAQTSRLLSGIAGGVIGLDTAYNEKVLLAKSIQNVQTQMRANRDEQAALINASMSCSIANYPFGRALSDLEAYYRAGTFTAGLIQLSNTVNKAESEAKATKDAQSPGMANDPNAKVIKTLQDATSAAIKKITAAKPKCT